MRPLLGLAALAAGGAIAVLGYRNLGPAPIEGEQAAFRVVDDGAVQLTATIRRDEPGRAADCIVRALGADHAEVARKELYVAPAAPGATVVTVSTVLRTTARATTAEVYGCSYDVPCYLLPP